MNSKSDGKTSSKSYRQVSVINSNEESVTEKFQLKRELGVFYGVSIIVGLVVGSGIYLSPQQVFKKAGSPGLTLLIWFLGGVYALFGALVTAEIGIQMPVAGEKYAYLSELYSPYFGFLYVWQYLLLVRPGSNALKLIIFGRYILKPMFPNCEVPRLPINLIASAVAIMIAALNCFSVKVAARSQSIMTSISITTLLSIAFIGLYSLAIGNVENLQEPFKDSNTDPGNLLHAFYATVFSYHGWSALNFLVEELKNPKRTLPIAITLSSVLLIALYVMVNLTYLVVLDKDEAMSSEAIAISMAMKISTIGGWIMSIFIALTTVSSCNSGVLIASRLAYAGARNGDLPIALSFINITFVTPIVSVIFMGLGIIVCIWIFEVEFILNNITFSGVVCDLFVAAGYFKRRLSRIGTESDPEKLKIPLVIHIIYILVLVLLTILTLVTNLIASAAAFLLVIATATIYYVLIIKWKVADKWIQRRSIRITQQIQKVLYCAPADKNE